MASKYAPSEEDEGEGPARYSILDSGGPRVKLTHANLTHDEGINIMRLIAAAPCSETKGVFVATIEKTGPHLYFLVDDTATAVYWTHDPDKRKGED